MFAAVLKVVHMHTCKSSMNMPFKSEDATDVYENTRQDNWKRLKHHLEGGMQQWGTNTGKRLKDDTSTQVL